MQGKNSDVFKHMDKITAFMKKLSLWKTRVQQKRFDMFPCYADFTNEHADEAVDASGLIVTHLTQLYGKFEQYFSAESMADLEKKNWVRNPFASNIAELTLPVNEESQLLGLLSDGTLKVKFSQTNVNDFVDVCIV